MRRPLALIGLIASTAVLLSGAAGHGQPPSGISRPDFEGNKNPAQLGQELFAANCASCHGVRGRGVLGPAQNGAGQVSARGPSLIGVGALAADFYLRTGYMPPGTPDQPPMREHVLFSDRALRALLSYV